MNFIRRIGYDAGATPLEDALAAQHGFHAGMHFSAAVAERMAAARDRLLRAVAYAETGSVSLFLENLNRAPDAAEVHCLGHTRCRMPLLLRRHPLGTLPVGFHPSTTPTWRRRA